MFIPTKRVWLAAIVVLVTAGAMEARVRRPLWPTAQLTEKADLIVIARAVSTADAKVSDPPPKDYDQLVGVDTEFQVLSVLKGKHKGDKLTLFHFRGPGAAGGGQSPEVDGPGLVKFDPKDPDRPRYLLFLKARGDGRCEPLSGQVDPNVSVSKLAGPSDDG